MNLRLPETAYPEIRHLAALMKQTPPAAVVNGPGVQLLGNHRLTGTHHAIRQQVVRTKPSYGIVGGLRSDMEITQIYM